MAQIARDLRNLRVLSGSLVEDRRSHTQFKIYTDIAVYFANP